MLIQIVILIIVFLLLPLYFIYSLWTGPAASKFAWLVKALTSGAFLLYIFLAGRWDWFSYYLRYLFVLLFLVALFVSYRRVRNLPFLVQSGRGWLAKFGWSLFELLIFVGLLAWLLKGYFYADPPVQLTFPLQDGWYYMAQSGNSPLLNYHNASEAQQYAMDITALNAAGLRTRGIYPTELEQYVIFGETIHSPCTGTVSEAVDGLPDNIPPATDRDNVAGNHVVIRCQEVEVVLAHMRRDSLRVEAGTSVTTGQPVGQVGNSGNTSEPHLHVHAVQAGPAGVLEGEGVPILFRGDFPVRNTTYVR